LTAAGVHDNRIAEVPIFKLEAGAVATITTVAAAKNVFTVFDTAEIGALVAASVHNRCTVKL
jgi:hypothetical protein